MVVPCVDVFGVDDVLCVVPAAVPLRSSPVRLTATSGPPLFVSQGIDPGPTGLRISFRKRASGCVASPGYPDEIRTFNHTLDDPLRAQVLHLDPGACGSITHGPPAGAHLNGVHRGKQRDFLAATHNQIWREHVYGERSAGSEWAPHRTTRELRGL